MSHIVLIDGHHLMYRAYWAIPRTLKTKAGEQVNMVFGMASMLLNILATEKPTGILFCFDAGSNTFRHQENETYKDGRAETPDDFYVQIPKALDVLRAFNIIQVSDPQYEADDLLATYAHLFARQNAKVTIVSGDRDLYQLASDEIQIAIPHKGYMAAEYLHAPEVFGKLGVYPHQVPCYKGLCGDASDNLPGVQGIGPKTAAKLLQEYSTLESIYEHIDQITGTVAAKLIKDKDQAFFCKRMATLIIDIPTALNAEDIAIDIPLTTVDTLFTELEFTMLKKRLPALDEKGNFNLQNISLYTQSSRKSQENSSDDQLSLF